MCPRSGPPWASPAGVLITARPSTAVTRTRSAIHSAQTNALLKLISVVVYIVTGIMKRGIVILFVVYGLAVAMVSRDRRAVNTEEVKAKTESSQSLICSRNTPCAWSIYKHTSKIVELNFNNSYCRCGAGTECVINEDDTASNAYIHRCRLPSEPNAWKGS